MAMGKLREELDSMTQTKQRYEQEMAEIETEIEQLREKHTQAMAQQTQLQMDNEVSEDMYKFLL